MHVRKLRMKTPLKICPQVLAFKKQTKQTSTGLMKTCPADHKLLPTYGEVAGVVKALASPVHEDMVTSPSPAA